MVSELNEVVDFISSCPPFDLLPPETVKQVANEVEVCYHRAKTPILQYGDQINHLYIIRSGSVEIIRRNGELYNRLEQSDIFGQMGLLMNNFVRLGARALEDTLVYSVPQELFYRLCRDFDDFSDFVEIEGSTRLHHAVSNVGTNDLTTAKVKTLLTKEPVVLPPRATVQQAAQLLEEENISALLIGNEDGTRITLSSGKQKAGGIVTDRDLCTRVLAAGLSAEIPVSEIMTSELLYLDHNAYIYEAMLTMLRHNIKHLPIVKDKLPIGIIEHSDIVRYESQHSLLIVNSIFLQLTIDDLASLSEQVKDCFARMVNEDANSHMIGSAMSVIGRSFVQRLTELAEEEIGPPPVAYCFLAFGSMARDEQLIVTDQDNGLIFSNEYNPEKHDDYFQKLATIVCDGLARCGYTYCTGNIMATNPDWRKTEQEWQDCFGDWIDNPNPQALLNSSIFFDIDGVYGKVEFAETLRQFVVERAGKNKKFLACLARNSLNRTPPLGFFKTFVLETDGKHKNSINLKRRGTAPLADIVRVHALAAGSSAQNTYERMDDIIDAAILPEGKGPDLRDAMEFISMVRIRHQAKDIEEGIEADNNVEPANMSDFERRHLKDAFQILSNAQNFIRYRYHAGH